MCLSCEAADVGGKTHDRGDSQVVKPKGDVTIAFAYVTDERGFELTRHSALSLAISQAQPCHIYIYCYQFTPVRDASLAAVFDRYGTELTFSRIGDPDLERHQTCGHVTTPTLLKLSVAKDLIGQYDRVVYLDSDMLVFDDLKIDHIDFGRAPVAAVVDLDLSDTGALRRSEWVAGREDDATTLGYFNAGLMIFAAENWSDDCLETYARALDRHDEACNYKLNCTSIDQCALNKTFEGTWLHLPTSFNMQAGAKFETNWQSAAVRHYCGVRKFIPIAPFRNDSRDIRHLNAIRTALGLSTTRFALMFELFFRVNAMRKRQDGDAMRRLLGALDKREEHLDLR
jgi:lipopolysaccharide biosynthesis glycosyltransferase